MLDHDKAHETSIVTRKRQEMATSEGRNYFISHRRVKKAPKPCLHSRMTPGKYLAQERKQPRVQKTAGETPRRQRKKTPACDAGTNQKVLEEFIIRRGEGRERKSTTKGSIRQEKGARY